MTSPIGPRRDSTATFGHSHAEADSREDGHEKEDADDEGRGTAAQSEDQEQR